MYTEKFAKVKCGCHGHRCFAKDGGIPT